MRNRLSFVSFQPRNICNFVMFLFALLLFFFQTPVTEFVKEPVKAGRKGFLGFTIRFGEQKSYKARSTAIRQSESSKRKSNKTTSRQDVMLWWPYNGTDTLFAKARHSVGQTLLAVDEEWSISFGKKFKPRLEKEVVWEAAPDSSLNYEIIYGMLKVRKDTLAAFRFTSEKDGFGFIQAFTGSLLLPDSSAVSVHLARRELSSIPGFAGFPGQVKDIIFTSGSDTLGVLYAGKSAEWRTDPALTSEKKQLLTAFAALWMMWVKTGVL